MLFHKYVLGLGWRVVCLPGGGAAAEPAAPGGVWAGFSIRFGGLKTGVKCDAHWTEMAPWEGRLGL